jgi:hypothetical protein
VCAAYKRWSILGWVLVALLIGSWIALAVVLIWAWKKKLLFRTKWLSNVGVLYDAYLKSLKL